MKPRWYLYNNSEAQSVYGNLGWIGLYKDGAHRHPVTDYGQVYCTSEFAFAHGFESEIDAEVFKNTHMLSALIFEHRDL